MTGVVGEDEMSYMGNTGNPNVGVKQGEVAPPLNETTGAGPLMNVSQAGSGAGASGVYSAPRRVPARFRGLEKYGFWLIVVAAIAALLVLLKFVLGPTINGVVSGAYMAAFVGALTLMNLSRPSQWANSALGRRVFPVLHAPDNDLWRLAGVNAGLTFVFATAFGILAAFIGPFIAGLLVFGGLIALGVFYNRARRVIINP